MIQINLLQIDKQKAVSAQKVDPTKPLLIVAMVVVLVAVALLDFNLHVKLKGLKKQVTTLKNKMNEPAFIAKLEQAKNLQIELDKLNRKQVVIDNLIQKRVEWARKLGALRDSLPGQIWVEQVQLTNPTKKGDAFQVFQIDAATVYVDRGFGLWAETLEALRKSPEFMRAFEGDLEDLQSRKQPWSTDAPENIGAEGDGPVEATPIWRFSFVAKRRLPESEVPQK